MKPGEVHGNPVAGTAFITIGFPYQEVKCMNCPQCFDREWNRGAKFCALGGHIISNPNVLDYRCPLSFEKNIFEEDTNGSTADL